MDATNWNMNLKTSLKSFITSMKYVQLSKHTVKFACRRSVENRQVALGSCKMRKWENAKVTKYKMRMFDAKYFYFTHRHSEPVLCTFALREIIHGF